jgi:hypothetical protein
VNLIQTNRLRTSFVHSSSYWNRIEKEGRKQRYRVKKEEEPGTTTFSLFEKTIIVILIPFNHFPTAKGLLIDL